MTEQITLQGAVCPIPLSHDEQIVMGHGGGGILDRETHEQYKNRERKPTFRGFSRIS